MTSEKQIDFPHFYLIVIFVTSFAIFGCVSSWWHDYSRVRQRETKIAEQNAQKEPVSTSELETIITTQMNEEVSTIEEEKLITNTETDMTLPNSEYTPFDISHGVEFDGYYYVQFVPNDKSLGRELLLKIPLSCQGCNMSYELVDYPRQGFEPATHYLSTTQASEITPDNENQIIIDLEDTQQKIVADIILSYPNYFGISANHTGLYVLLDHSFYYFANSSDAPYYSGDIATGSDLMLYQTFAEDTAYPYQILYTTTYEQTGHYHTYTYYIFYPNTQHTQLLFSNLYIVDTTSDNQFIVYYPAHNYQAAQIGLVSIDSQREIVSSNKIWISENNFPKDGHFRYYDDKLYFLDSNGFLSVAQLGDVTPTPKYNLGDLMLQQFPPDSIKLWEDMTVSTLIGSSEWTLVNSQGILGGQTTPDFTQKYLSQYSSDTSLNIVGLCICHNGNAPFDDEGGVYFDFATQTFHKEKACYYNGSGSAAYPCEFGTDTTDYL